jgi:hypothetical protein
MSCEVDASDKDAIVGAMPYAAMARETEGASDANRIAKHAIHAVMHLVRRFMPMKKF